MGNLQIHIQKSATQQKSCTYIPSNFFLVALGGLTWKIFLSEREGEREGERERVRERENVYMQENLMGMGNG